MVQGLPCLLFVLVNETVVKFFYNFYKYNNDKVYILVQIPLQYKFDIVQWSRPFVYTFVGVYKIAGYKVK